MKYRDSLANEDEVTWLKDEEEFNIVEIWLNSIDSGMSGAVSNYDVIKDRCRTLKMEVFEVYKLCRSMTSTLNKKD